MPQKYFVREAKLVKVLAHAGRLEIIHLLRQHTLTVGQITQMLGARQAYVSQQLSILKSAKLLTAKRNGKEMYYALADPRILKACDAIYSLVSAKPLASAPEPFVVDPVCQMKLTPTTSHYTLDYAGVRNYFCGQGCYKEFSISHKGSI